MYNLYNVGNVFVFLFDECLCNSGHQVSLDVIEVKYVMFVTYVSEAKEMVTPSPVGHTPGYIGM